MNRVASQGASFELTRGGERVARLVPASPPNELKVADLGALFERLPGLDQDAIDAFERDIAESDGASDPDRAPWT